jgi:hypothetical protein
MKGPHVIAAEHQAAVWGSTAGRLAASLEQGSSERDERHPAQQNVVHVDGCVGEQPVDLLGFGIPGLPRINFYCRRFVANVFSPRRPYRVGDRPAHRVVAD